MDYIVTIEGKEENGEHREYIVCETHHAGKRNNIYHRLNVFNSYFIT